MAKKRRGAGTSTRHLRRRAAALGKTPPPVGQSMVKKKVAPYKGDPTAIEPDKLVADFEQALLHDGHGCKDDLGAGAVVALRQEIANRIGERKELSLQHQLDAVADVLSQDKSVKKLRLEM